MRRRLFYKPRRRVAIAALGGAAALVGLGALAYGPAAPWLVDHLADGQKIWRLGRLRVDGVEGVSLAGLRARHLTLADAHGVWGEADNVVIGWRPFDLLSGVVRVDAIDAARIHILRQPELSAPEPESGGGVDVMLERARVASLVLDEPVVGVAANFRLDLGVDLRGDALQRLDLEAVRMDSDADRVTAHFANTAQGAVALNGEIVGAAGGVIAHALGDPRATVRATASGTGSTASGALEAHAHIGDSPLADARLSWRDAAWRIDANAHLAAAPLFADYAARLGDAVQIDADGVREGAVRLHAQAPNAILTLTGDKTKGWALAGPAHVVIETPRFAQLMPELLVEGAAARLEGDLDTSGDADRLTATIDAHGLALGGQSFALTGPLHAQLDPRRWGIDAQLAVSRHSAPLFEGAALDIGVSFDRARARFALDRARLEGPSVHATATGWSGHDDGEFAGEWGVKRLQAFAPDLRGGASGRWRMRATPRGWAIALDGAGNDISGEPAFAPALLGRTPRLDAALTLEDGLITLTHARLDGAKLRAGARGTIRDGASNIALEASARGPIPFGAATVDGAADATGRLSGDIGRPRIDARATLATIDAGGVVIERPIVTVALVPDARAYRGQVGLEGQVSGQAAHARSDIVINDASVAFPNLVADVGAAHLAGHAGFTDAGISADLALSGAIDNLAPDAAGRISGHAVLAPRSFTLEANLADAHVGALAMRTATISASGPYEAIRARFALRGALGRASLSFAGDARIDSARNQTQARVEGEGALAGAAFRTRTPMLATWRPRVFDARLDAAFGDGALTLDIHDGGAPLAVRADLQNAPLAPLMAIAGEEGAGRMSGRATLANAGAGLRGDLDLTLDEARFSRRSGEAVSGHVVANLAPDRLTGQIDARSSGGLVAHFEADAPVTTHAETVRIALAPARFGRASWSVHGPVGGLWAAARLNDQNLSGDLNGEGNLRFGAGSLSGEGSLGLSNGRFEDKLSGVKLEAVDAEIRFDPSGVQIARFNASDGHGGRVTATGGATDPEHGNIALTLANLRLVDRPDARATASGQLAFAWQGLSSSLSGDIALGEAQINVASAADAGVAQLDVVEINRPDSPDAPILPAVAVEGRATTLDLRVHAPGRVFTRGRGLDAEWSLDLRLAGDAQTPRVVGTAEIVRGSLSLSGRQFDITSGRISFSGDPTEAALDLTAERETTDLTAIIRLTGTAARPEIALSSTPALPEDEILPQVLFGRSVQDLSPLEAAQLAASIAALSGRASFDLAEAARAISGLDRLDVRQDENGGGLLVAGGLYLTRDVYVEVGRTGLGQASTRVEWRVRPQLMLVTSFLQNGDQRVSLRWRTKP